MAEVFPHCRQVPELGRNLKSVAGALLTAQGSYSQAYPVVKNRGERVCTLISKEGEGERVRPAAHFPPTLMSVLDHSLSPWDEVLERPVELELLMTVHLHT